MVHSKKMKKGGVIRVIIFILLVLFVCYLCIAYNYNLYRETMMIQISDERVDLDGADFSFLFMIMGDAYKCFDGSIDEKENLRMAEIYWQNGANEDGH